MKQGNEPGNELSKKRDEKTSVKLDEIAKIMAAGTRADVKYAKSGSGQNENDGQSIMKKKRKDDSVLCLGKVEGVNRWVKIGEK